MTERSTVYYDGGCPVCSREIGFYQRRRGGQSFAWVDVTRADEAALGPGLSREAAYSRLHVRRPNGPVVDAIAAFGEIWRGMPGLRWLGLLVAIPPIGALTGIDYRIGVGAKGKLVVSVA